MNDKKTKDEVSNGTKVIMNVDEESMKGKHRKIR